MKKNFINYYSVIVSLIYAIYNCVLTNLNIGGLLYQLFMITIIIVDIIVLLKFKKEIKFVAVSKDSVATKANSFQPYQYYLYTGQYPLIRTLYVLMADPLRGLPWGFSNFLVSPKGQLLIFRSSILPYRADLTVKEVIVN